jgi:hypothetical protein
MIAAFRLDLRPQMKGRCGRRSRLFVFTMSEDQSLNGDALSPEGLAWRNPYSLVVRADRPCNCKSAMFATGVDVGPRHPSDSDTGPAAYTTLAKIGAAFSASIKHIDFDKHFTTARHCGQARPSLHRICELLDRRFLNWIQLSIKASVSHIINFWQCKPNSTRIRIMSRC